MTKAAVIIAGARMASRTQPRLTLNLLGPFQARSCDGIAGEVPLAIGSTKTRALLAYLALSPDLSARREPLADLLWGDRPDSQARQSLRQALLVLRRDLGHAADLLLADRDSVRLAAEGASVDVLEFARLAASPVLDDLARAVALYRGPLLADVSPDSEPFSAWLGAERARLHASAVMAAGRLADLHGAAGRGADALAAAERLLAIDPLDEESHRVVIRLTARHATARLALARAERFSDLLRQEMDVAPDGLTRALVAEVRAGSIPAAADTEGRVPSVPGIPANEAGALGPAEPSPSGAGATTSGRIGPAVAGLALLAVALGLASSLSGSDDGVASDADVAPACVASATRGATRPGGAKGLMKAEPGSLCRFTVFIDPENNIPPSTLAVTREPRWGRAAISGHTILYQAGPAAGGDLFLIEGDGTIANGNTLPFRLEFQVEIR